MQPLADLLSHLKTLKNPIIVGHENADPDAVASAYVLANILNSRFGFPREVSREGKALLRFLDAPFEINPKIDGKDLIVVDTSAREMLNGLNIEAAASVTVIDHHSSKPMIKGTLFIFPEASSTSEIIYDLTRESSRELSEKERIAILAGILFDTRGLQVAPSETIRKVAELLGGRTVQDILELISFEEDVTERIARLKALRKGEIVRIGDFLIAYTDAGSFEGSVANVLVTAGADIAIAYSSSKNVDRISIRLSRRATRRGFDASKLLSRLKEFGAECGGHRAAAGCKLPPKSVPEAVEYLVNTILDDLEEEVRSFGVRRY